MKKKKAIIISGLLFLLLIIVGVVYFIFNKEDKKSTLTLVEKQWIESNKNNVIDFGLINDVAILNNSGEGIIFDFMNNIEENTGLDFNKVSYKYGDDLKEDYSFKVVDEVTDDDILIYSDNYVLIGKENEKYNSIEEIKNSIIGVLEDTMDITNKYLANNDISYKSSNNITELLNSIIENSVDYIVLPKLVFLSNIKAENDLYINYNITEINDNYVITLGETKKLNNILKKYYKKWSSENFDKSFMNKFANTYFNNKNVEEQSKVKFKSKRYVYGFVEDAPFDIEVNGKLVGINNSIIKDFANLTNVEITYDSFSSVAKLKKAFANGDIDFYFDRYSAEDYDLDYYNTVSMYDEKIVVASHYNNRITINTINSLDNKTVITLSNTKLCTELDNMDISYKAYNNMDSLFSHLDDTSIVVLDEAIYNFYKDSKFKNFKIDYLYSLDDNYSYIIRDIKNNEVFEQFFNFYLGFANEKVLINDGYYSSLTAVSNNGLINKIITVFAIIVVFVVAYVLSSRFMPNKKKKRKLGIKKEDKLRYVDMLTSLKNRNYLNDNIEKWDESEVYPQSIIIVDLNNIAYINDNYGHQEGDEVIKQAANVLITNQMPNSDIIRTNGNEFLIYMVEYDEKQVVSYIKKLNKEFKDLQHGFGAAIGYSIITDGIKTIDDAVNEATLDMRNNKEELNN